MVNILMTDDNVRLLIADSDFMILVYDAMRTEMCFSSEGTTWEKVAKRATKILGRYIAADVVKGIAKMLTQAHQNQKK